MKPISEKKGWWARNWKWFVPVAGLGALMVFVGCVALLVTIIFGTIKSSDVCQQALTRFQENPEVVAVVGTPIKTGLWISGSIEVKGPRGSADLAIPVSGPKGSGTLYVVATKSAGVWEYTKIQFSLKGSNRTIDIVSDRSMMN